MSEVRQRVGPQVMSRLFHRLARPLATPETPVAFLGSLRLIGVLPVPAQQARRLPNKIEGYARLRHR